MSIIYVHIIIIGKLGQENKAQMSENIPSYIGQLKAGTNYLQVYLPLSPEK